MNSSDKHSLITGGGSGIGLAVARQLIATRPDKNTVHSFDIHAPLETVNGLVDHRVDIVQLDAVSKRIRDEIHGYVELLFNNAGVLVRGGLLDVEPAKFQQMLSVNVLGSWNMTKTLLDQDKLAQGATILQMSSVVGGPDGHRLDKPIVGAYALTKRFVHEMAGEMKGVLAQLRPDIKFKTIYPGAVKTPMTMEGFTSEAEYDAQATANWGVVSTAEEMGNMIMALIKSDANMLYWDAAKQEYVME